MRYAYWYHALLQCVGIIHLLGRHPCVDSKQMPRADAGTDVPLPQPLDVLARGRKWHNNAPYNSCIAPLLHSARRWRARPTAMGCCASATQRRHLAAVVGFGVAFAQAADHDLQDAVRGAMACMHKGSVTKSWLDHGVRSARAQGRHPGAGMFYELGDGLFTSAFDTASAIFCTVVGWHAESLVSLGTNRRGK